MPETTDVKPLVPYEPSPLLMLQTLIDKGADPDKLTKLMDLAERWEKNRAAEVFGAAIAKFQSLCPAVFKARETKGGKFTFRFASLDDVMAEAKPHLATCGISVAFDSEHKEEGGVSSLKVTVRVRVGSYFEDRTFTCPVPKDLAASMPQQYGAALSYAKRYALCAALNIVVTDEDNDAQEMHEYLSDRDKASLLEFAHHVAMQPKDLAGLCKYLDVADVDHILEKDFTKAVEGVRNWARRQNPEALKTYKPGGGK